MKLWIARDKSGVLALYPDKPMKAGDIWDSDNWFILDMASYPEVTFDNSPQEVELKLIEK